MKICEGEGAHRHNPVAHVGFLGKCPLCVATYERDRMREALQEFASGHASIRTMFSRISNAGVALEKPAGLDDNPSMEFKLGDQKT